MKFYRNYFLKAHTKKHYLLVYSFFILLGLAVCVWSNLQLRSFRDVYFDFSTMTDNDRVLLNGLTREQIGEIKLGFLLNSSPPDIGIFGNHQIQHWGRQSLGLLGEDTSFYNYYFANLALPDIYDYLLFAEQNNRLPTKLIVVQMTTPNNDNGDYIAKRSKELPADLQGVQGKSLSDLYTSLNLWMAKTFDYATFILGLFQSSQLSRLVSIGDCGQETRYAWTNRLPSMVVNTLSMAGVQFNFCDPKLFQGALQADGSISSVGLDRSVIANQNALDAKDAHLSSDDTRRITKSIQNIITLGARNGIQVLLVIPPVFETPRPSLVNDIVDLALAPINPKQVIDHRRLYLENRFFVSYDHPSNVYYQRLSDEIFKRLKSP